MRVDQSTERQTRAKKVSGESTGQQTGVKEVSGESKEQTRADNHYSCLLSSALVCSTAGQARVATRETDHNQRFLTATYQLAHRPLGAFCCSVGYHKKIFFFHRGCWDRLLVKNHSSLSQKGCMYINGPAHGLASGVLLLLLLSMWEVLLIC